MRLIEKLIFSFMLPTTLWLFDPQWPKWISLFALVTPGLVLIHAAYEGIRWQMISMYGSVILLIVGAYAVHENDI